MAVRKEALGAGESYASITDLLAANDMPQESLKIYWPTKSEPQSVLVRGLNLEQRELARTAARRAAIEAGRFDGGEDLLETYRQYLVYGMVVPPMNEEQARQFTQKHAGTVAQLCDLIHEMSEPDYAARITAIAKELAGVEQPDDTARAKAPRARKAA